MKNDFSRWIRPLTLSVTGVALGSLLVTASAATSSACPESECAHACGTECPTAKAPCTGEKNARLHVDGATPRWMDAFGTPVQSIFAEPDQGGFTSSIQMQSQSDDGEDHSVSITRRSVDGSEEIELEIDGVQYDVETMEDVKRILREKGIDSKFQFDLGPRMQLWRGEGEMPNWQDFRLFDDELEQVMPMRMQPPKSMLGVHLAEVEPALRDFLLLDENQGVIIEEVLEGTPADKAGFRNRDLVLAVRVGEDEDWTPVTMASFRETIGAQEPETEIEFKINRSGNQMTLTATLEAWDESSMSSPMFQEVPLLREEGDGNLRRFFIAPDRTLRGGEGFMQPFRFDDESIRQLMEEMEERLRDHEMRLRERMMDLERQNRDLQRQLEEQDEQIDV